MGYKHTNSKGKTYFLHCKDVQLKAEGNKEFIISQKIQDLKLAIFQLVKQLLKVQKQDFHFVKGNNLRLFTTT